MAHTHQEFPGILHRNFEDGNHDCDSIGKLTFSFLYGIWLIFMVEGPSVETMFCLLLGSDKSLWTIILCGVVVDDQLHFWSFLMTPFHVCATHSTLVANREVHRIFVLLLIVWAHGKGGGGEVEGTAQSFIRGSNPRTKPLPFYIPYLSRKRYPSCISSIDKWYPFHRSRTLHPYNLRQKWYFWQCSITEQTEIAILAVWTEWLGQLGGTVNSFSEVYLVVCCKFE